MNRSQSENETECALSALVAEQGLTLVLNSLARLVAETGSVGAAEYGCYWRVLSSLADLARELPDVA